MTTPSIPEPKAPPKAMQAKAKAERERRKACHGTWVACTQECDRQGHTRRADVVYDDEGRAMSWNVMPCTCAAPWRHA